MKVRKLVKVITVFMLICNFIFPVTVFAEDAGTASAMLSVDNQNVYKGMSCSYSEGYIPTVADGYVTIVLPILCDRELKGNKLRISAELGDVLNMPFVCKNYEKTVKLAENEINYGSASTTGYLATFRLELNQQRRNGNYPVVFHASAVDSKGNVLSEDFTVYVMISDGITQESQESEQVNAVPEPAEAIVYKPKVLVKSYECKKIDSEEGVENSGNTIEAGDSFRISVTLWNTSNAETLKNTSVTITSPETGFTLLSPSDTVYIGNCGAGKTKEVTFEYKADISVLPGQYDFAIDCDYAYGKGESASGAGKAKVNIAQKMNVEFDNLQIPTEVTVSDTVTASIQAMNLGKTMIYNVRAVIDADGLNPEGTLFIGNMEPGSAASSSTQITVSGLKDSSSSFGDTKGTITYYYEDAEGNEYSEEREFQVSVVSPFSNITTEPEDEPEQWWIIMLVIVVVIGIFAAVFVFEFLKRRKKYEMAD